MEETNDRDSLLNEANKIVFREVDKLPKEVTQIVQGYNFDDGINYDKLLSSYSSFGIQATNLHRAIDEINRMIAKKKEPLTESEQIKASLNPIARPPTKCSIFLSYTSNMVSCGVRELIAYLARHNQVDVLCTTGGGIEEDFIKCLSEFFVSDFHAYSGRQLYEAGINRIGNMLVPNKAYCEFEKWILPHLEEMLQEQRQLGTNWTPSKIIKRLGERINDPRSIYYWCAKNEIPVFCPSFTDGSIGDMLFLHSSRLEGFKVDIVEDICRMNKQAMCAANSGMIILGGGSAKHHVANANLMRNGADYSVYINTGLEIESSDAGADPDEAMTWGKIRRTANPVKVFSEASLVFPLVVAKTFAVNVENDKNSA